MLSLLFSAPHCSSHIYSERDWVYSMAHFSVDPCCTRTIPAQLQAVRAHLTPAHSKAFEAFSELVQGDLRLLRGLAERNSSTAVTSSPQQMD